MGAISEVANFSRGLNLLSFVRGRLTACLPDHQREAMRKIWVSSLVCHRVYDDLCHNAFLAHQLGRIFEDDLAGHVYPAIYAQANPPSIWKT
jgi:hypothetical protein